MGDSTVLTQATDRPVAAAGLSFTWHEGKVSFVGRITSASATCARRHGEPATAASTGEPVGPRWSLVSMKVTTARHRPRAAREYVSPRGEALDRWNKLLETAHRDEKKP